MKTAKEVINDAIGTIGFQDGPEQVHAFPIIEALDRAGFFIAPKEPTEEMIAAGKEKFDPRNVMTEEAYEISRRQDAVEVYYAMTRAIQS